MKSQTTSKNNGIKVNFHICEHCNYKCRHCFAKFQCIKMLSGKEWEKITDNVLQSNHVNYINIAGGEPLLHPDFDSIVSYIHSKGVKLSLITNGFCVNEEWIRKNAKKFDTIGFSIDTLNRELQIKTGRSDSKDRVINADDFRRKISLIRKYNPNIRIKVNTVVSDINRDDRIAEYIKEWKIDRWKILKMQLFDNGQFNNRDIEITNDTYDNYVSKSLEILGDSSSTRVVLERAIQGSYIMIGANGWLLDDTDTLSYRKIINCLTDNFSEGLRKLKLNKKRYMSRYLGTEQSEYTAPSHILQVY